MTKADVVVIDLWPIEAECWICGDSCGLQFGVPRYEDAIVPDDYEGEWGGAPVCLHCFLLVRGMQGRAPRQSLMLSDVRAVRLSGAVTTPAGL